jgi:Domain of unknown function (DUF4158)
MTDGGGAADDPWTLTPADHALVMSKRGETRLGFAILLSFFRERGRFPRQESEVDLQGIAQLSRQLDVPTPVDGEAFLGGRTAERIRSEIRVRFGFREATVADAEVLTEWLRDHVAAEAGGEIESIAARLETRCRELAIEPPSADREFANGLTSCWVRRVKAILPRPKRPRAVRPCRSWSCAAIQGGRASPACRRNWRRWS